MELVSRTDPWFRVALALLLLVEAVVLGAIAVTHRANSHAAAAIAAATPATTAARPAPAAAAPSEPQRPAAPTRTVIHTAQGAVGPIRLGMRVHDAEVALGETSTPLQVARTGVGSRFQVLFPTMGITASGNMGRIDTIRVTNTGYGHLFHTSRSIGVGALMSDVPKRYAYAIRICSSEWWVQAGKLRLRLTGESRISGLELTSRPTTNDFATCSLTSAA